MGTAFLLYSPNSFFPIALCCPDLQADGMILFSVAHLTRLQIPLLLLLAVHWGIWASSICFLFSFLIGTSFLEGKKKEREEDGAIMKEGVAWKGTVQLGEKKFPCKQTRAEQMRENGKELETGERSLSNAD